MCTPKPQCIAHSPTKCSNLRKKIMAVPLLLVFALQASHWKVCRPYFSTDAHCQSIDHCTSLGYVDTSPSWFYEYWYSMRLYTSAQSTHTLKSISIIDQLELHEPMSFSANGPSPTSKKNYETEQAQLIYAQIQVIYSIKHGRLGMSRSWYVVKCANCEDTENDSPRTGDVEIHTLRYISMKNQSRQGGLRPLELKTGKIHEIFFQNFLPVCRI